MYQEDNYVIARQKLGFSQKEVANKIGLKQSIISKIENGKSQKLYKELIDFYVENGIDENLLIQQSETISNKKEEEIEKIKEEVSFLMRELLEVRRELSKAKDKVIQLQDDLIDKFSNSNQELGKHKVYLTEGDFVACKMVSLIPKTVTNSNTQVLAQG